MEAITDGHGTNEVKEMGREIAGVGELPNILGGPALLSNQDMPSNS